MKAVDDLISDVIRREAGFVDRSSDRGGPTKFGITAAVLGEWRRLGRAATADEVRALTEPEARTIYRAWYLERPGLIAVQDEALRALLFDVSVNNGQGTAVKLLQRALDVPVIDGVLGPQTRAALATARDMRALYVAVWRQRQQLYLDIALGGADVRAFLKTHPSSQLANLRGWLNRNAEFVN